mgnify:CR=1 FL=1
MKKITYIGLERCDFIYHLATILSLQGNVLINDRSVSLDLIKSVSPYDDLNERVDWRNIVTVKDADTDNSDVSDFEYVIDYVGMYFEEKDFYNNTLTLMYCRVYRFSAIIRVAKKVNNTSGSFRKKCPQMHQIQCSYYEMPVQRSTRKKA